MSSFAVKLNERYIESDKNFLIVEDDPTLSSLLIQILQGQGFNGDFIAAANIKEAYSQLDMGKINVILCDWNLPDGEGIDLLMKIREYNRFKDLTFLMITGRSDIESMMQASEYNVDDYLVKPFKKKELIDKLENIM